MRECIVTLFNHQEVISVSAELLQNWQEFAGKARELVLAVKQEDRRCVLPQLEELEFSLVDDDVIARVHGDFMNIPTPTDVITFDHGEVLIGIETAKCQAVEFDDHFEREIGRYIVHGLLHLAGYYDDTPERAEVMTLQQEGILQELWPRERNSFCLR